MRVIPNVVVFYDTGLRFFFALETRPSLSCCCRSLQQCGVPRPALETAGYSLLCASGCIGIRQRRRFARRTCAKASRNGRRRQRASVCIQRLDCVACQHARAEVHRAAHVSFVQQFFEQKSSHFFRYTYDVSSASGMDRHRRSLDHGRGRNGSGSPRGRKDSFTSQGSQGSPRNAGSPSLQVL